MSRNPHTPSPIPLSPAPSATVSSAPPRRTGSRRVTARLLFALLPLLVAILAQAQSPTQPTKEYIRAGGKLIAIEIPGSGAPAPVDNASVVSVSAPSSVVAGSSFSATIRMKNTGNTTWPAGATYQLGSANPADNTAWGPSRVNVPYTVAPNADVDFTINATAPASTGVKSFDWQMVKGSAWFGGVAPASVTVTAAVNGVTPAAASVYPNQLLQLTATTSPLGQPVTWTLSPSEGTITSAGLYTAPGTITSQHNITATARLTSNSALVGTSTITLKPAGTSGSDPFVWYSLPKNKSGLAEIFRFDYGDPDTANTIDEVRVRFSNNSTGGTDANICSFRWTKANNQIELFNDAGTALLPPIVHGIPNAENSACVLIGESIISQIWGAPPYNTFELVLGIGFRGSFASGTKYIQMRARDNTGRESTWHTDGTWGFPANSTVPTLSALTALEGYTTATQKLKVVATDTSGFDDIGEMQFVVTNNSSQWPSANSCHLYYFFDSQLGALIGDNPASWAIGIPAFLPGQGDISNSQCDIIAGSSEIISAGNTTDFRPKIRLKGSYASTKNVYAKVTDEANNTSNFQYIGQFVIGAPANGVSPAAASVYPNQILQLTATTSPPGQPVTWSLSPNEGTITAAGLYTAPGTITLQHNITATALIQGTSTVVGTSTITLKPATGTSLTKPSVREVNPESPTGLAEVMRFLWGDPQGAVTIDEARVRISGMSQDGTDVNSCSFRWTRANNQIELFNDAGTALLAPIVRGATDTENSACKLIGASIISQQWGGAPNDNFELVLGIGFKTPFAAGLKYIHMSARDNTGMESGWSSPTGGTWNFPANTQVPSIYAFSPGAGTYTATQTFTVTAQDMTGWTDINGFQFVIADPSNSTFPAPNACHFFYFRDSNMVVLLDSNPVLWAANGEIETWNVDIANSQCNLILSQSGKGSQLTYRYYFQPKVQIKTSFLGNRKIWVLADDNAGNNTGYQYKGQFNFTSASLRDLQITPSVQRNPITGQEEIRIELRAEYGAPETPSTPAEEER